MPGILWLEPSPGLLTDVTAGTLSPKKVQMTVRRGEASTPQTPDPSPAHGCQSLQERPLDASLVIGVGGSASRRPTPSALTHPDLGQTGMFRSDVRITQEPLGSLLLSVSSPRLLMCHLMWPQWDPTTENPDIPSEVLMLS